ncbi:serine/threonine protein kinase [Candidatus Vecturithrix granuli]|uniref:Serine/threonine protein kinase n=1 Tax=Vecturithrix granuli TaxID=1499967 RepID=A0A081C3H1_VECG1|nr:serine/threonine protein kinase [Candidatus Vecturithrix granuli]
MIRKKQLILSLCLLFWLLGGGVFGARPVSAQNPPSASKAEQAKILIVKVRAKNSFGAGILFSLSGGYLFIATANHVVQGSPKELEELFVEFEFLRGATVPAEFVNAYPKLDLAVLRVDIENSRLRDVAVDALPFNLLGKTLRLQRGEEVYPIGHPEGEDWDVPATPAVIKKVVAEEISFEPSCFAGHSGGGLFDANWTLVGMMTRTLGRSCEAISFERICATLEDDWGLVVNHEPLPLGPVNAVPIPATPTVQPTLSVAEQQQQQLQDLLAKADAYFKLKWYTTPPETNAFDVYRQVLQLDPDNPQALQSIQQMLAFYKSRAEQAEKQGNSQKAIQYYQGYLKIAPNDDEVLDKLLQLQTPTPPLLPTSTPTPRPTVAPTVTPTSIPKQTPKITLRSTPRTVSDANAKNEFGLDANRRPIRYVDNDFEKQGEVVIDHATGLMWQQSGSGTYMNYTKAQEYIKNLNRQQFAGYNDWRLPTIPELMSLLEPKRASDGLYIDPIFDRTQMWCWSADIIQIKDEGSSGSAWHVYFSYGNARWNDFYNDGYVRAVRSRQ